jgi:hypothetical protein
MATQCRAPARMRRCACPRQTQRPYSQSGTLSTSACSRALFPINSSCTATGRLYLARRPKRIDVHVTHIRCAPLSFSLFGELTSSTHAGAFFAELADALAAPTFAHRLALYVGHDGTMVRLLAGLGVVPLRWPAFGAEVVFEVRPFV